MRHFALAILSVWLGASVAHAQERVTTLELGEWAYAISTLQADTDAAGRVIHVCVDPGDHTCAPCGRYTLSLDEAGARAFRVDACDPSTGATRIVLVDRSALFDHDDVVPRPRVLTIHAALVHDVASSGGSHATGGSALSCTARVSPFLRDLEHGTVLYLGPDRYDVRVEHAAVSATAIEDGWILSATEQLSSDVDYVVVDRATGREELRGHTSLVCTSETSADLVPTTSIPPPPDPAAASVRVDPPVAPDQSAHFTIRGGVALDWAFGLVNVGGAGAIGARGWLDAGHWLSWWAELAVSGFHGGCGRFDGHCASVSTSAPPLSVDVLGFSAPFTLGIALVPGAGLQLTVGFAPGVTYLFGSNGRSVDATVATGTVLLGLAYQIGWSIIGVHAGYRALAVPFAGDVPVADAYGQAFVVEIDAGLAF